MSNKILDCDRNVVALIIEMILFKADKSCWKKAKHKLKTKYNSNFEDCLDNPEHLKEILLDVYAVSYLEIVNKIKSEFDDVFITKEMESLIKILSK